MNFTTTPLNSADAASSGLSQAEIDARDIAMLGELAEITMGVAREIGRLAMDRAAEGDADEAAQLSAVLTKVGRAVRQSVSYRRKIEDEVRTRNEASAGAEAAAQEEAEQHAAAAQRRASGARKTMIDNAVSRLLEEQKLDLYDDLYERLDEYESFADFTDKPVSTFILEIADALELDLDWERFAYDTWAAEEINADPPVSPLAKWWHSRDRDQDEDGEPPEVQAAGHGPPLAAE